MTTLLIDANNACWKNHHVLKELTNSKGRSVGIVFGLLRDLPYLTDRFSASRIVFCFDKGRSLRLDEYPEYKASRRKEKYPDKEAEYSDARAQIALLHDAILPMLGFRNVLSADGYEADDLIASVALNSLEEGEETVVVSGDHDLYQLLSGSLRIWNHKKEITLQSFHRDWNLRPIRWCDVKAIAGCTSDGIKGVGGVGEKTAAKYLRGELKEGSAYHRRIRQGKGRWEFNLDLVKLPYPGCPVFELNDDQVYPEKWDKVVTALEFPHLKGRCPLRGRR